jgi:hypothetical protein
MKNLYLLLLPALGLSFSVQSQLLQPAYSDSALHQNVIETEGVLEYQGTAMRGEFQNTLIFGGFIDEEMKSRSFDRHGELNRLGGNGNGEIRYIHGAGRIFDHDTLTWMIKAGYTAIGNLQYGKDAFGLVFYGNSDYLGKTAVLTNTRLDCMQFQKIGFGLVSKKNKTSVTLNLVNVQNYAGGYVRKGEIEHAADGSQIAMTLNGDFRYGQGSSFSKGLGAAVDIDYRIRVPWFKGTFSTFQLSAQNLGFAYMHEGVKAYKADSAYSYNGFDFDAFRDGNNPLGKDFSLLDSLGIASRVTKRAVLLPGYIQVMKLVELNTVKKVQSFFGIRLYPSFSSVPLIFAGAYWKTARILHTSASLSYGGFGNLRAGVYATLVLSKVNVMIGTDNLAGIVSRSGSGESVVTRLIWKLN